MSELDLTLLISNPRHKENIEAVIKAARDLKDSIFNCEPNKLWRTPNAENLAIGLRAALERLDRRG